MVCAIPQVWHFAVVFGSRLIWVNCCWLCLVIDILCIVLYNSTFLSSWISQLWVAHSCCSLERSKTACQENSRPVSVCGTIFICRLGICDLNQMPLSFLLFFFSFPAIGSTRWRCDLALQSVTFGNPSWVQILMDLPLRVLDSASSHYTWHWLLVLVSHFQRP